MNKVEGVGREMVKGAAWAVLMRVAIRSLGFVSTIVLARLLTPDDYGLIALAMVFIGLLESLTWFGFDVVLIHDQHASEDKYHTAWTLTVARGILLAAVVSAAAGHCAILFEEPRIAPIMQLLALGTLVESFACIGVVNFRKNLQFDKDFRLMVIPRIAGFLVTVVLALILRNYWAMAIGMVSTRIVTVATGYAMHPYRPAFRLTHWREVLGFSKWLLFNSLLRYGYNRGPSAILGKLADSHALGVYSIAYEISNMVLSELVAPVQRALLPGFAKLSGDIETMRATYLDVLSVTMLFALPMALGIALTADLFVPLLLGEKWLDSVPLIQLLCICGLLHVGVANSSAVYIARGRPWVSTVLYIAALAIGLPAVFLFAGASGAMGAARGMVAMAATFVAVNTGFISRALGLTPGAVIQRAYRPALATAMMTEVIVTLDNRHPNAQSGWNTALDLAVACSLGAITYVLGVFILWFAAGRPAGVETTLVKLLCSRAIRNAQ
ncbi:MAG: lipopolysaccharide biosynthesis protein [Gammaproteobacteria bacterium]|nr:lipopolysaccharide biosynthesis protein [Gammaproteobacteria bacterium]